jgi:Rrf2 family protein
MLSRSAEYAIATMAYLAQQPSDRICAAHEIASATGIHLPYLWKILGELTDAHLIVSRKGASGGYCLARNPKKISTGKVLAAVSEELSLKRCIIKHSKCDLKHPCALHKPWDVFRKRLDRTTMADLGRKYWWKP